MVNVGKNRDDTQGTNKAIEVMDTLPFLSSALSDIRQTAENGIPIKVSNYEGVKGPGSSLSGEELALSPSFGNNVAHKPLDTP